MTRPLALQGRNRLLEGLPVSLQGLQRHQRSHALLCLGFAGVFSRA